MDIYLPVAGISVNAVVIVLVGGGVGFLSGMFGVGGGFLTTPFLIFYGVPPAVAVASSAPQITGASVSGVLAHARRGGVDYKMGFALVLGGFAGSAAGSQIFRALQQLGQIDTVISAVYVILLGTIGALMLRDSLETRRRKQGDRPVRRPAHRHHAVVAALPLRTRFYRSGLYISPLAPIVLGALVGMLTVIMGVGGGFILVPAMIYLLGMSAGAVVGTSLFQIIFVTAATTLLHSVQSQTVDIVLAVMLLAGGVIGAQYGAKAARSLPGEKLRLGLAILLLLFAALLAIELTIRPAELFSVQVDPDS